MTPDMSDTLRAMLAPLTAELKQDIVAAVAGELRRQLDERLGPQELTREETARRLMLSTDTVDRRCADGTLTFRKIGRAVRISASSLAPADPVEIRAAVRKAMAK